MINEQIFTNKVNEVIAKVLSMLPSEIDIDDTGLYLEAGLTGNIDLAKQAMTIPLKTLLRTDKADYTKECPVQLGYS